MAKKKGKSTGKSKSPHIEKFHKLEITELSAALKLMDIIQNIVEIPSKLDHLKLDDTQYQRTISELKDLHERLYDIYIDIEDEKEAVKRIQNLVNSGKIRVKRALNSHFEALNSENIRLKEEVEQLEREEAMQDPLYPLIDEDKEFLGEGICNNLSVFIQGLSWICNIESDGNKEFDEFQKMYEKECCILLLNEIDELKTEIYKKLHHHIKKAIHESSFDFEYGEKWSPKLFEFIAKIISQYEKIFAALLFRDQPNTKRVFLERIFFHCFKNAICMTMYRCVLNSKGEFASAVSYESKKEKDDYFDYLQETVLNRKCSRTQKYMNMHYGVWEIIETLVNDNSTVKELDNFLINLGGKIEQQDFEIDDFRVKFVTVDNSVEKHQGTFKYFAEFIRKINPEVLQKTNNELAKEIHLLSAYCPIPLAKKKLESPPVKGIRKLMFYPLDESMWDTYICAVFVQGSDDTNADSAIDFNPRLKHVKDIEMIQSRTDCIFLIDNQGHLHGITAPDMIGSIENDFMNHPIAGLYRKGNPLINYMDEYTQEYLADSDIMADIGLKDINWKQYGKSIYEGLRNMILTSLKALMNVDYCIMSDDQIRNRSDKQSIIEKGLSRVLIANFEGNYGSVDAAKHFGLADNPKGIITTLLQQPLAKAKDIRELKRRSHNHPDFIGSFEGHYQYEFIQKLLSDWGCEVREVENENMHLPIYNPKNGKRSYLPQREIPQKVFHIIVNQLEIPLKELVKML